MRPSRPFATAIVLASLVAAGCSSPRTATPAAAPAAPTSPTATTAARTAATTSTPPATTLTVVSRASAASACAPMPLRGWGTGPRQHAPYSGAPVYGVRAGRHACYDRVVFDLNGPEPVGYDVRYVDVVRADGSGNPVPVAGQAALQVVIHAPALGLDSQGHQPGNVLATPGQDFYAAARLAGWDSLRQVRYAGSFEGQTTVAVGVRARAPFHVFTVLDSRNQIRRVVLDIAH